jgi:hypothetical protein
MLACDCATAAAPGSGGGRLAAARVQPQARAAPGGERDGAPPPPPAPAAQESLGGNAKTSLVIAVANAFEHGDETAQSLAFGTRASRVRTRAVVNERADFRVINAELVRAGGAG